MQNDEHGQGDEALPYPVIGEAAGDNPQDVAGSVRAFDSGDSVGIPGAVDVTGAGASADAASAASDDDEASLARDSRTVQVADHGVDVTPVPPAVPVAAAAAAGAAALVAGSAAHGASHGSADSRKKDDNSFTLRDFFLWCGIPVLVVVLIRVFLVGFYEIPSRSMMDTIVPGDRVIASKLTPKYFDLQRGDIVVFKDPNNWLSEEQSSGLGGGFLIKRLIGLPGDVVECKGAGQPITINGVAVNETAYIRPGVDPSSFPFSVTVTEGHVFVMGDNRANSADSRYHQDDGDHGMVPISDVVGIGLVTYWPLNRIGMLDAHHEVFADVPDASSSAS